MSWAKLLLLVFLRLPDIVRAVKNIKDSLDEAEFNKKVKKIKESKGGKETAQALHDLFA